jgi:uncharacterized phiE125 gp8 family phage protein
MWNRLHRVTAPAGRPVTLSEAKMHLRVDGTAEDTLIERAVDAATAYIDGPRGIGHALVDQQWDLRLDCFPWGRIVLPLNPVRTVDEITYTDTAGTTQTLDASRYIVSAERDPATIEPAYNENWPSTRLVADAVKVRFTVGYEPDTNSSPTDYGANVPNDLKAAVLWLTAHIYENRMPTSTNNAEALPFAVENILARYRAGAVA